MILQLLGVTAPSCGGDPELGGGGMGQTPAATPTAPAPCGTSTPIAERPGYEACESGLVHRAFVVSCENTIADHPEPGVSALPPSSDGETNCSTHGDCVEHAYGYCRGFGIPLTVGFRCFYGCVDDDECDPGGVCHCQAPVGTCASSECATDAECGKGLLCVEVPDYSGCGNPPTYACQTAADECSVSTDCPEARLCLPSNGRFACVPLGAVCGRPLLIAGEARLAGLVEGREWSRASTVMCAGLTPAEREMLGTHWARVGLMEHASVAAFARFTLQLLQVGAPVEFVSASIRAQADEAEHAKLAFGLASAYLDASVGPGVLPLDDMDVALPLRQVLRLVLREGCVGETLAALEASQALDACREPAARAALERIARDESSHSELAWSFVRWALGVEPALLGEVEAECARLRALLHGKSATLEGDTETSAAVASLRERRLAGHGFVSERERALLHGGAIVEVVLPCLDALVALRAA